MPPPHRTTYRTVAAALAVATVLASGVATAAGEGTSKKHKKPVRNTPDIEATPLDVLTIDQEMNVYAADGVSNTTVDYGLPHAWNVGLSFLNAQFNVSRASASSFQPDVLFNLEKHLPIGRHGTLVAGAQTGAGVLPHGAILMNYSYVDGQWLWPRHGVEIGVGVYSANRALAGRDSLGWHANLELPLPVGRWRVNGDYLSGSNGVSGATVKLLYPLPYAWQVGLGVQIPAPRSGNDYSALLGFYWH